MEKELTAEECFKSTELAKFKNKKSFRKETMFDFAEHYHEIKSKELKDELHNYKVANSDIEDWNKKLQARVKALEEVVRDCIVRMETVSEETSNINHENILNTDLAYQALKTK